MSGRRKANLTLEIPEASVTISGPKTPTEDIPFPPFPPGRVDEEAETPFVVDEVNIDDELNKKIDEFYNGRDDAGAGATMSPIRNDVRHKFHYRDNSNKAGAYNHIVGYLTTEQDDLNNIVQYIDTCSQQAQRTCDMLRDLRKRVCDFANF